MTGTPLRATLAAMKHLMALIFGLAVAPLTGCQNACQQLCVELEDFAIECGIAVPQSQLIQCLEDQAGANSRGNRKDCRQNNSPGDIRDEWTCEDMEIYWGDS